MDRTLAPTVPIAQFLATTHPVRQLHRVRCLSVSHRTADVATRARFALDRQAVECAYERLAQRRDILVRDGLLRDAEVVVLSTCNRTELFIAASDGATGELDASRLLADEACAIWADLRDLTQHDLTRIDTLHGPVAIHHLLELAAGLDSVVLGESQILQQLKEAYMLAHEREAAGPILYNFFHAAFRVGRRARAETSISEGNVSTASVGAALAQRAHGGSLRGLQALLIGAGDVARLCLEHLLAKGVRAFDLVNRTREHAESLALVAREQGATVRVATLAEKSTWQAWLGAADVILTAATSDLPLVQASAFARPSAESGRHTVLVDLGLPPNVDPTVDQACPWIRRFDVDSLRTAADEGLQQRLAEVPKVRRILGEEWELLEDTRGAITRGVIDALFRTFAEHNDKEVQRQAKFGVPSTPEDLRHYGQRLIRRLLKPIVTRFGKLPAETPADLETLRQLVDLFGLHPPDVEGPASSGHDS